ncbi:unnamed protein product [Microthlaspi erraticum]|uniref:Uncharacterized protein n=1 Tax=Microthlaspi erraticum TaxID=1685480 RepID=A0A6D2KDZ3_9BRAS|nr:unnamed protein product [Microthlaspi erraticum]
MSNRTSRKKLSCYSRPTPKDSKFAGMKSIVAALGGKFDTVQANVNYLVQSVARGAATTQGTIQQQPSQQQPLFSHLAHRVED